MASANNLTTKRIRATSSTNPTETHDAGKEDYGNSTCCFRCGSGNRSEHLILCDKCHRRFHLYCHRPLLISIPKGPWFCQCCTQNKKLKRFPHVQTMFEFQRRRSHLTHTPCNGNNIINTDRKRRKSSLMVTKKKRKLLPFVPTVDPQRRNEQMASVVRALTASRAKFSDELTYKPRRAPRSANVASLEEGGMQIMAKEDIDTLNMCKVMMERGECPPLFVVLCQTEGFTVEADEPIKDLTIITEYTGDVDYLKNREHYDGNSMMTLLSASDSDKILVICPDKRGNIARFINGINNHTPDGKKKQNLKCVRYNVNGEARVLLIAIRDIRKGERLYFDYNGYEHAYPTEHFV